MEKKKHLQRLAALISFKKNENEKSFVHFYKCKNMQIE